MPLSIYYSILNDLLSKPTYQFYKNLYPLVNPAGISADQSISLSI